jgi:hypothetical protein
MDKKLLNENMIKILGIENLPEEQKADLIAKANELVQTRVLTRVFESLPKDKQEGLSSLIESGDEISITNFINHNCPDFQKWMTEEVLKIKEDLSQLAKETK